MPNTAKVFLLTIEDAAENATLNQSIGVDEEIKTLYAEGFEIDLACVESVFEQATDLPDQPSKRAEYKVYRLSCKVDSVLG